MKEKIFPVSSYVAINDDDGDVVVKTLPPHQQLPRRESQVRSVRKDRREEEAETENLQDKNDHPIKKSEEEEDGEGGMAVLPVAGRERNGNNFVH